MIDSGLVISRTLAVYDALTGAGIPCAIGGALALDYHIDDPRATRDIDVDLELPREDALRALTALPDDVPWDDEHRTAIERDGQVRIQWSVATGAPIPLDLFFAEADFHARVAQRTITVPLRDRTIRVLSATDLTVFKALSDRSKDWPDIEAMLATHDSTVDLDEAIRWVGDIVGAADLRTVKLRALQRGQDVR